MHAKKGSRILHFLSDVGKTIPNVCSTPLQPVYYRRVLFRNPVIAELGIPDRDRSENLVFRWESQVLRDPFVLSGGAHQNARPAGAQSVSLGREFQIGHSNG